MSGSSKAGCCCGGTLSPCLIHSTILTKSKPWAAWTLVSGTAPTTIDDGFQFYSAGKITIPHDARQSWRQDTDDFTNDPGPHELKRLLFSLWLDDADTYVVVTLFARTGEYAKVHFKSWTPATAHYAIVNAWLEWLHVTDGTGYSSAFTFTEEMIADEYDPAMQINYNNGAAIETAFPGTYVYAPAFTWSPVGLLGAAIHPNWNVAKYGGLLLPHYDETAPADDLEITIEVVNGAATFRNVELYHDGAQWEGDMTTPKATVPTENGDGCPGAWADDARSVGCLGSGGQAYPMANSVPNAIDLVLPTLNANPSWNGVTNPCADCTVGGGGTITLFTDATLSGVIGADQYCQFFYLGADTLLGCHFVETEGAQVQPYHDYISGDSPFVGIDYEGFPFRFTTDLDAAYDGSINPLADHLSVNGLSAIVAYNMALLIDNADTSGAMVWETALTGSVNACMLTGGGPVEFRLAGSFSFGA